MKENQAFDSKTFLARADKGRTLVDYRKSDQVFAQGAGQPTSARGQRYHQHFNSSERSMIDSQLPDLFMSVDANRADKPPASKELALSPIWRFR